eukprot:3939119-Rhodomonas_salina.2
MKRQRSRPRLAGPTQSSGSSSAWPGRSVRPRATRGVSELVEVPHGPGGITGCAIHGEPVCLARRCHQPCGL